MIQKDINLFEAGKAKAARQRSGGAAVLLLSLFFTLVVAGCYGWIIYLQTGIQQRTQEMERQLADPQLVEAQLLLKTELQRYNLMLEYRTAITKAGDAFDRTRVVNPALLQQISGCLTADTTLTSLSVNLQGATLTCRSTSFLAPAAIAQALERLDAVAGARYDSITRDEDGFYYFMLTCSFKEVTLP